MQYEHIKIEDQIPFYELFSDATVTHMNGRKIGVKELFDNYLVNQYSFSVKKDGNFVGVCSLFNTSLTKAIRSVKAKELIYSISPDFWNQGIASSAVKEICARAFLEYDLDVLLAGCFNDNLVSARVLEKNGFRPIFSRNEDWYSRIRKETIYLKIGL